MKYSGIFSAVSLVCMSSMAYALPSRRDVTDADILNFALTLEHLESTFYSEGLAKHSEADFEKGGFPKWVRGRFEQIAEHESTHVEFLTTALSNAGVTPVKACEYKFNIDTPRAFVQLAEALESVGSAAYTGASGLISNHDYVMAAASILTTEGRHSAWINSAALESYPWSTAFEAGLTPNQVYTLAGAFITNCPSDNPKVAATAYPSLAISGTVAVGKVVKLTFKIPAGNANLGKPLFVAFIAGNGIHFASLSSNSEVTIPDGLIGTVFAVVTNDNSKVTDATTVAGPAIMMLPYPSTAQ